MKRQIFEFLQIQEGKEKKVVRIDEKMMVRVEEN